jgi:methylated-DNA-[protein]-cysteine S-methyltransferase
MQSPVGELLAVASERGLSGLLWPNSDVTRFSANMEFVEPSEQPAFAQLAIQLDEYFAGTRRKFDLPLDLVGTEFQLSVWDALQRIPFGETRTYSRLAATIGRPSAVRAVGAANGKNPISIVVPCHRVIGADGSLTGFAGGLEVKRFLLEHERGIGILPVMTCALTSSRSWFSIHR